MLGLSENFEASAVTHPGAVVDPLPRRVLNMCGHLMRYRTVYAELCICLE